MALAVVTTCFNIGECLVATLASVCCQQHDDGWLQPWRGGVRGGGTSKPQGLHYHPVIGHDCKPHTAVCTQCVRDGVIRAAAPAVLWHLHIALQSILYGLAVCMDASLKALVLAVPAMCESIAGKGGIGAAAAISAI